MNMISFGEQTPQHHESAWIASGAQVIGKVTLGQESSVWFNSVLRGDTEPITIGEQTNIQDLSMGHTDPGFPLSIGDRVTVGHRCILHGCSIEDDCLIGMGAILMNGVTVGHGSIIGAGAVVLENTIIPPFSLVVGSPAKVKKTYGPEVLTLIRKSSQVYVERASQYR